MKNKIVFDGNSVKVEETIQGHKFVYDATIEENDYGLIIEWEDVLGTNLMVVPNKENLTSLKQLIA
jgi:hypothetical protein